MVYLLGAGAFVLIILGIIGFFIFAFAYIQAEEEERFVK